MPLHAFRLTLSPWVLSLFLLPCPALANLEWTAFAPQDGSFRVEMPGVPTITTRERRFLVSHFFSTVYRVQRGADVFGVNHTDIPKAILLVTSNSYILKSTREGFLESSGASELAYEASEVDGQPAGELIYSIPAGDDHPAQSGTARLLLVGNRLFIFYAEVTREAPEAEVRRYFRSIRIPEPKLTGEQKGTSVTRTEAGGPSANHTPAPRLY